MDLALLGWIMSCMLAKTQTMEWRRSFPAPLPEFPSVTSLRTENQHIRHFTTFVFKQDFSGWAQVGGNALATKILSKNRT